MSETLLALHTGTPGVRYSQDELAGKFADTVASTPRRAKAIERIFRQAGVGARNLSMPMTWFFENHTTEIRNQTYVDVAIPLGERVIVQGLAEAGYAPQDIDDLIVVSCTGISTPGLDLHLAGRLGMRPDLRRTTVLGMGCYGAFPALNRARDAASQGRTALVLSVELCSLHMQHNETAENAVSCALFADGAAMALVGPKNGHATALPELVDSQTHCDYTTLEHMSFDLTDHGFRMYLSSYVPGLLAAHVTGFVDTLLARNNLTRDDVRHWGIHPGSTRIVDYVSGELGLPQATVQAAHDVLHEQGNMSSATILFVLDQIHRCNDPQPGDYGVFMAFGPGLTMESLLVRW